MAKKTAETKSIVIVGVGGQGILLASEILAQAAMLEGYDIKTNEVHGMAQRGGSVMAMVRYGREVHSPLVARRSAHILGSLEKVEALRYADYIRQDGLAVVSSQAIMPVTVSSGAARYPEDAKELLHQAFPRLVYIDAAKIARRAWRHSCGQYRPPGSHLSGSGSAFGVLGEGHFAMRAREVPGN